MVRCGETGIDGRRRTYSAAVSEVVERPSLEFYARRWAGTVTDIAEIARAVLDAFEQGGRKPDQFYIEVETFQFGSKRDLEYQTVDAFLDGARALDLATIYGVTISGTFPHGPTLVDDQSAYVRFEPQPGLAVHIHVQAPAAYEEFVIAVADQINHLVERGERPLPEIERGVQALSVACSLGAIFLLALTHRTAWTITGLALTVGGVLVLLARRALHWLFPPFELLPEGGFTRLRTIWNRARGAAVSTARPVYAAFLGAVLVLLLRRLIF
jgi:hypothetical protein